MSTEPSASSAEDTCFLDLPPAHGDSRIEPVIEKYEAALLMLLGFAGFSVLIGLGYNLLRRYVFSDSHNLDIVFDAGGRVSLSLTAVTVTSQLLWPADFLQSPTIASKVGVGGSLWYTMAIVISLLAFSVLCIQLKTRAPGAKTFPQIAYARFGKGPHLLFCTVALFTNMVIIANMILAGRAAITVLTKESSNEFVCLILAVLFGSYCLIGGLGTTFYISYFNTSVIFITTSFFILKTTYLVEPDIRNTTSLDTIYHSMSCLKGPEGNYDESLLTFRSESGLIYGVVTLFMTIAVVFCDQANWQSRIAAKPQEGMVGFLIAAFLWFAIPTSISFVSSMTYKSMSYKHGSNLLTEAQIDAGYITPFVIQSLLGKEGCFVLLTLFAMALMSTGSGEIMSVSSILVYDIFKTYIRPFRTNMRPTDCPLCGLSKLRTGEPYKICACPLASNCTDCAEDIKDREAGVLTTGFLYKCAVHGKYRHYEDELLGYKSWAMIWVIVSIVPFGLVIIASGMNLNWAFLTAQVLIAPFLVPLYMTIAWSRATGNALLIGGLSGLVCSVTGLLTYASTYPGGLSLFFVNTAQDYSVLTGLLAGFVVSTVITIGVSLKTPRSSAHGRGTCAKNATSISNGTANKTNGTRDSKCSVELQDIEVTCQGDAADLGVDGSDLELAWQKTMSIDNPLNPYRTLYKEELAAINITTEPVNVHHMEKIFKKAKYVSAACASVSFLVFLVLIPSFALSQTVLTQDQLAAWISTCQHWCMLSTALVVIIPPLQEGREIYKQYQANKTQKASVQRTESVPLQHQKADTYVASL